MMIFGRNKLRIDINAFPKFRQGDSCTVGAGLAEAVMVITQKSWQNLPLPNIGYQNTFFLSTDL
jgi:hypothetical protein